MFEFFLSVRVSFWLVGAGRMPPRSAATESTDFLCLKLLDFLANDFVVGL